MKRYVLVDDLIKELNETYKGHMTDFCLIPLGVENWLNDRAKYPVQLHLHSKETPDPELNEAIEELRAFCEITEGLHGQHWQTRCCRHALRYLEQLRLLKGEYARVFFEERKE